MTMRRKAEAGSLTQENKTATSPLFSPAPHTCGVGVEGGGGEIIKHKEPSKVPEMTNTLISAIQSQAYFNVQK